MNYQILYHELVRRRKIEIALCHKSVLAASKLFAKIIEANEKMEGQEIIEMRILCNETCAALDDAYQELLYTDVVIEDMRLDENVKRTIIYSLNTAYKDDINKSIKK